MCVGGGGGEGAELNFADEIGACIKNAPFQ